MKERLSVVSSEGAGQPFYWFSPVCVSEVQVCWFKHTLLFGNDEAARSDGRKKTNAACWLVVAASRGRAIGQQARTASVARRFVLFFSSLFTRSGWKAGGLLWRSLKPQEKDGMKPLPLPLPPPPPETTSHGCERRVR